MLDYLLFCLHLFSLPGLDVNRLSAVPQPIVQRATEAFAGARPLPDVGIHILWDRNTLTRVSGKSFGYSSYARMVQLNDESLLCVYEADGSIMAAKSLDGGKSWQEPAPVAWRQDGINMAAPDVIELQDKSILVCYNPRPYKISGTRSFGIRTRKSYDGGRTWIHGRLLYEAGHKFINGCWEPSAIQMPDGEIQLFFANESPYRDSDEQNISLLRSHDNGLTWTEKPEVTSFRAGGRDGMPSPLLLQNGREIVYAIEDLGWLGYFKPAVIRTAVETDWSQPVGPVDFNREYALYYPIGLRLYAGAPYLRQLSTGETLLSYQGTEGRRNNLRNAEMKVVIGDTQARNFCRKTVPFDIPADRYALWSSLTILKDDTVVAITTTNAFSGRAEVWMIKGYVVPD